MSPCLSPPGTFTRTHTRTQDGGRYNHTKQAQEAELRRERDQADNLLGELATMASHLKAEAYGINEQIATQNKVLDKLENTTEDTAAKVSAQHGRMQVRTRKAATSCCAGWLQMVSIFVVFFLAVVFMRIFPRARLHIS